VGYNGTVPVISPQPVPGSTALPSGFSHPHASEEARAIAETGMILLVQVGSGVHGTSITGQDDRDEMGLCLEPPQFITGLARVPNGTNGQGPSVQFQQYERHTAWDRPGGLANRSGADDLDTCAPYAKASVPWPRSWKPSTMPRHGWAPCGTAPPSRMSRIAAGSMNGCTAVT